LTHTRGPRVLSAGAPPAPSPDRVEQPPLVDPEPVAEPRGLMKQADLRGEQRVVDELHALPGADGPHVKEGGPITCQHRTDVLDGVVGAPDEQRYLPCRDIVRAAADRRVD